MNIRLVNIKPNSYNKQAGTQRNGKFKFVPFIWHLVLLLLLLLLFEDHNPL